MQQQTHEALALSNIYKIGKLSGMINAKYIFFTNNDDNIKVNSLSINTLFIFMSDTFFGACSVRNVLFYC